MTYKIARINVESLKGLEKYISNPTNPKFFFTMTEINKVGINPRSGYNTPIGVYCYPLTPEFYNMILTNKLPFVGEQPYIVLFTVSVPTFNLTTYTESDLLRDTEKVKLIYNWKKEIEPNETGAITDFEIKEAFKGARYHTSIGKFWNLTRILSGNPKAWAHLLRKLGYTNFYDPGVSVIHPNEPTQAVILDPQTIIPIETFFNPYVSTNKQLSHVPSSDQNIITQRAAQLKKLRTKLHQIKDPKAIDQIAKNYIVNGDIISSLVYNKNISTQTIEYIVNNVKESDNFDKYTIQDLWAQLALSRNTPIDVAVKVIENTEYLQDIFGKRDEFGRTYNILSADLLRELAKNNNSQIKIYVANNIYTPLDALEILTNDNYDLVREAVAFNRNSSTELLDKLAEDNDRVKLAVIKGDKTAVETLKKIMDNTDNGTLRSYIAYNSKCTPEMLETLFADTRTHSGLANNSNISEELLNKLVDSPSDAARMQVAKKTNDPNILEKLATDPYFYVKTQVFGNENTPIEVLEIMTHDKDVAIRVRLATDKRSSEKILNILSNDANNAVRQHVASNRNAPFQALSNLSEDKQRIVRQLVAENIATPIEVLEKLTHDEDELIGKIATRAIASKLEKQTSASANPMLIKQSKKEISLKAVKKLPYETLARIINKAKNHLKTDDTWKKICKEYDEDVDIIDLIPTKFGDLDVSATTEKGVVTLNYKLLCDGDFFKNYSYLIHEFSHFFQQCYSTKPTQSSDDGNYLENPFEQDAFTKQVSYIDDNFGKEEAEDYVDNLLDHHDVTKKKEKDKLEAVFLKDVE